MNDRKKTIEVVSIDFPTGSTPMTIAETIVRSCSDIEWIKDIIYWLNAFVALSEGGDTE